MMDLNWLWSPYGLMVLLAVCAVLLLYMRHLFALKAVKALKLRGGGRSRASAGDEEEVLDGYSHLMGRAKPEIGVSSVSAEEVGFGSGLEEDRLGLLADVQQEIRELCQTLADNDGNKEDFFELFALVRSKYPRIVGHPMQGALEEFIREQAPFFLSAAELESLWD